MSISDQVVVLAAPYRVEIADVPVREPAEGEPLVRAEVSGIGGGPFEREDPPGVSK